MPQWPRVWPKSIVVALDAGLGGDVEQAAQAEHGVDAETHQVLAGFLGAQLEQRIEGRPQVAQVGEEIVHTGAHWLWGDLHIGRGHRPDHRRVDRVVEAVYATVEGLQRIARVGVGAGGTTGQQRGEARQHGELEATGN